MHVKSSFFDKNSLGTLRMSVGMCEKLFLKAPNVYSLLFHFLKAPNVYSHLFHFFQLFVGWDQFRVKLWHFLLNYFVSFLLIYFAYSC